MKRAPLPGVDPTVYVNAIPLLVRNPSIIVVPLLTLVIGVLIGIALTPSNGAIGQMTAGLGAFIFFLIALFGVGAACVVADDAWRHGRANFERAWTETRRRGGEILTASIGVALLVTVGQYVTTFLGAIGLVLTALIVMFLIWALPAAAVGGIPGGAAIQVSIDRVRGAPLAAALATIVTLVLGFYVPAVLGAFIAGWVPTISGVVLALVIALIRAVMVGYIALVLSKTYSDEAFGRRRW
ncbi:MAG TPA: hypothetical protein VFB22_16605 [Candidatus Baltobacteraceae bacterium]|nr:hypothetical protein [Candidatus Baltobacteraceae bacterium]